MSDIFSAKAREIHRNRTLAKMHMKVLGIVREIDSDIASRSFAYLGHHVRLKDVFAILHVVADELLAFDERWSRHELRLAKLDLKYAPYNPFCVEAEQSMVELIEGQSKALPRQIAHDSKKLHRSPESMQDFANHVKSDVLYKIKREYGERRESFNLSVREFRSTTPQGAFIPESDSREQSHESEDGTVDGTQPDAHFIQPGRAVPSPPLREGYLGIRFDDARRAVYRESVGPVSFADSALQWELLCELSRHHDIYLSDKQLTDVWKTHGVEDCPVPQTIRVAISNLRSRIRPLGLEISTRRNIGRRLEVAREMPKPAVSRRRPPQKRSRRLK